MYPRSRIRKTKSQPPLTGVQPRAADLAHSDRNTSEAIGQKHKRGNRAQPCESKGTACTSDLRSRTVCTCSHRTHRGTLPVAWTTKAQRLAIAYYCETYVTERGRYGASHVGLKPPPCTSGCGWMGSVGTRSGGPLWASGREAVRRVAVRARRWPVRVPRVSINGFGGNRRTTASASGACQRV